GMGNRCPAPRRWRRWGAPGRTTRHRSRFRRLHRREAAFAPPPRRGPGAMAPCGAGGGHGGGAASGCLPPTVGRPACQASSMFDDGIGFAAYAKVLAPSGGVPRAPPIPDRGGRFVAKVVNVSATRTAIGTLGGALAQQPATKLGAIVVREAIRRAKLAPEQVDEVILGHVLPAGLGLNPARVAAMEAGVPKEKTSF